MRIWEWTIMILLSGMVIGPAGCTSAGDAVAQFETVLRGGRVIDPESGLDAVRNVGVRKGRIEAVSRGELSGGRVIDVSGLVVAPGFIDLHEHGQTDETYRLMVQDGVTSAFELEVGTGDVAAWYRERERGQFVHYGVSIGHIPVRMIVFDDPGEFLPAGVAASRPASQEQIEEMKRRIEVGLAQGAVAVGFGAAYTPAASILEFETLFRVAARHNASAHIHVGEGLEGLTQALEAAAATGVSLQVVHVNSSGGSLTAKYLEKIVEARSAGQDVTTEAYPYEASMTSIQSAFFDDWESWDEEQFQRFQWVETGEWLTRESFGGYHEQGGYVIIHKRTEAMTRTAIASPLTMIASDGFLSDGKGHPRTSGTYSKVLGKYVREERVLTLMEALRKMTIEPARRLDRRVAAMRRKGRVQVGADADLTVFDPETVSDQATYSDPTRPSRGIEYVLVNGEMVVERGRLKPEIRPGKPIRAEQGDSQR